MTLHLERIDVPVVVAHICEDRDSATMLDHIRRGDERQGSRNHLVAWTYAVRIKGQVERGRTRVGTEGECGPDEGRELKFEALRLGSRPEPSRT